MDRRALLGLLITGTLVAGVSSLATAGHGGFHATLTGYEEVPAVSTDAQGTFRASVVSTGAGDVIRYTLTYTDPNADSHASHIHFAAPRVNGGVIAFLCGGGDKPACPPGGGTIRGSIDSGDVIGPAGQGIAAGELDEALAAMEAGFTYVNVHSTQFPGGEIRGQITAG